MLPSMLINPACGVLAGVPIGRIPTGAMATSPVTVHDFVDDVVEEVIDARPDAPGLVIRWSDCYLLPLPSSIHGAWRIPKTGSQ
jgi:hypothetical protein